MVGRMFSCRHGKAGGSSDGKVTSWTHSLGGLSEEEETVYQWLAECARGRVMRLMLGTKGGDGAAAWAILARRVQKARQLDSAATNGRE